VGRITTTHCQSVGASICACAINLFGISGIVGVDNGRGGGFETLFGDHCITMNGRCYQMIPMAGKKPNGLSTFMFDGTDQERLHNLDSRSKEMNRHFDVVRKGILQKLFNEQKEISLYARELKMLGQELCRQNMSGSYTHFKEVSAALNGRSHGIFDVGTVSVDNGDKRWVVGMRLKNKSKFMDLRDKELNALMYPLLFPYGEDQWCLEMQKDLSLYEYLRWIICCPEKRHPQDHEGERELSDESEEEKLELDAPSKTVVLSRDRVGGVSNHEVQDPEAWSETELDVVSRLYFHEFCSAREPESEYVQLLFRNGEFVDFYSIDFGLYFKETTLSSRNVEDYEFVKDLDCVKEFNRCFFIHYGKAFFSAVVLKFVTKLFSNSISNQLRCLSVELVFSKAMSVAAVTRS